MKWLDLTIDGADEFDANLNLIKGGGAALLQEKIVATASDRMIVIADAAKEVAQLGAFPLPVEVIPFGWQTTKALVEETLVGLDVLGRDVTLRMNGDSPLVTDEANFIIDLHLKRIGNPRQLALVLNQIPGVVENGLFIDICDVVVDRPWRRPGDGARHQRGDRGEGPDLLRLVGQHLSRGRGLAHGLRLRSFRDRRRLGRRARGAHRGGRGRREGRPGRRKAAWAAPASSGAACRRS